MCASGKTPKLGFFWFVQGDFCKNERGEKWACSSFSFLIYEQWYREVLDSKNLPKREGWKRNFCKYQGLMLHSWQVSRKKAKKNLRILCYWHIFLLQLLWQPWEGRGGWMTLAVGERSWLKTPWSSNSCSEWLHWKKTSCVIQGACHAQQPYAVVPVFPAHQSMPDLTAITYGNWMFSATVLTAPCISIGSQSQCFLP